MIDIRKINFTSKVALDKICQKEYSLTNKCSKKIIMTRKQAILYIHLNVEENLKYFPELFLKKEITYKGIPIIIK